ncbi:unnamed protein product [Mycena citricolor]|uniref:YTH domain-containing protein n=1 Tax=Mycena citricolor TaxID=2018698 RepID=A0AAD2I0J4_9AGAR|nr:unnamed protein product [Mycena citricolor]
MEDGQWSHIPAKDSNEVHLLKFPSLNDPPADATLFSPRLTEHHAFDERWSSPPFFSDQAIRNWRHNLCFPSGSSQYHTSGTSAHELGSATVSSSPIFSDSENSDNSKRSLPVAYSSARGAIRTQWAMWVGNLPPDVTHEELHKFFTAPPSLSVDSLLDRLNGVVSIISLRRSACAFVNYKTARSLEIALVRFHGSCLRKDSVKALICRVQGEFDNSIPNPVPADPRQITVELKDKATGSEDAALSGSLGDHGILKRFFVMKSFSQRDLDLSVETGLWATQRHNEFFLDQAFRTAKEVFLVFSVNKSGNFYGFARMTSVPQPDSPRVEWSQTEQNTRKNIHPKASAPGFWCQRLAKQGHTHWGKEFGVQWICTRSLPFAYADRLVNPWNRNRRIQVARDGTEIEPGVGQQLLEIWAGLK